jgi:hypothetical protein
MAIKRWNGSTSQWELVGTPGTATPSAIGAATLASGGNTFLGVQTITAGSEWPLISRFTNPTSTHRNHILLQRSNNNAAVTSGFNLGGIAIAGHDGTSYGLGWNGGAEITAYASQTWTSSARGTDLAFITTALNTTTSTEKMRIVGSGDVNIGGASNAVNTLRYFDIYNTDSGNSAGTIIRLITNNAANTAVTTVDMVKYRNGSFVISNNDSAGIMLFNNAGAERMRIDSNGRVGIGAASVSGMLEITHVDASAPKFISTANNNNKLMVFEGFSGGLWNFWGGHGGNSYFGISENASSTPVFAITGSTNYVLVGYTASQGAYKLQVNSQIFATSSSIATSDGRYKENVLPISSGLDIIDSLNPVSFDWKAHPVHNFVEGKTVGFIAQEVKESLKDYEWVNNIIKTNTTEAVLDEEGNEITPAEEFLGIAESNIIPLLVAAVKELRAELNTLKAQITN